MRAAFIFLTLVALAGSLPVAARADVHDVAPADEYFGPFKESILGIRNRLGAFEGKADNDLIIASTIAGIDNIEIAIEDWQHHYPRDPWVPKFLNRLVHVYVRAHAVGDQCAQHAIGMLERDYGRSREAAEARSAMGTP